MGRPDLSQQRTAEILDAFECCVSRYGLAGSSLERVAEEAGVKRGLLRHYLGNRDEMVEALAERVMTKYRYQLDQLIGELSEGKRVRTLLDFLFRDSSEEDVQSMLVVEALIAASDEYPICRKLITEYLDHLVRSIAQELQREHNTATRQQCWSVAFGLVGIGFNNESLAPLELPRKFSRAARDCAQRLVESLG